MTLREDLQPGESGHAALHNAINRTRNSVANARDYASLTGAVAAAKAQSQRGGVVYIPPGVYTIHEPLVLPRTGITPLGVVHVLGAGRYQTTLQAAADFPPGRALIEWEAARGRAWEQRISGLGFLLPNIAGVKAIHYKITDNTSWTAVNIERFQLDLEDIYIAAHNDYHDVLIKLEGICNYSSIRRIYGDPAYGNGTYDTLLLQVDSDYAGADPAANDAPGLYCCDVAHLYGMIRRGGCCATFEGRLHRSTLTTCFSNGGKQRPNFNFRNSLSFQLDNLSTEGQGEKPQYRFENCRFATVRGLGIGTPNAIGASGVGNGVELVDCHDNTFDNRYAAAGNPAFSGLGVKLLTIDAASKRNHFTRWGVRPGTGGVAGEFSIAGTDNTVDYIDVLNDVAGTLTGAPLQAVAAGLSAVEVT